MLHVKPWGFWAGLVAMTLSTGCGRVVTAPIQTDPGPSSGIGQVTQLPTGTVTGRIVNARTKLGLAGVQVLLLGAAASANRSTLTNGAGEFTLTQVPAAKQKLALYKPGYTFLASNGDVVVDVIAGSTVTTADIPLTEGVDALPNAFLTSFNNVRLPRYLAFDRNNNWVYTVAKTNFQLGSVQTPKELWEVKRFDTKGGLVKSFGAELNFLINEAQHIFEPAGMTCEPGGNVLLCDPVGILSPANPIKRYNLQGDLVLPVRGTDPFPGADKPLDIQALRDGFAVVTRQGKLMVFNSSAQLVRQIPVSGSVAAIAADANDNLYVVDAGSQTAVVKKYDLQSPTPDRPVLYFGTLRGRGQNQFENPTDIAVDNRNGDFYVVDSGNNRVIRYSSQGTYLSEFGGMGPAPGQFNQPTGVTIDADGNVYVSDTQNNRIQKFSPSPIRQPGQNR
ncbi:MAG: carboxypeptidase regulatory-like domain-containing protein [bacterium]|nr:carboxypeptidase regulatory-like domain-containing protein [bacterium]